MKNKASHATAIQIFNSPQFGDIRIINTDDKPLFIATDVAKSLGYTNSSKAIGDHCSHVTKRYIGVNTGTKQDGTTAIQNMEMSVIPESDVFRLIMRSKLPQAEAFQDWVCEDILPSIRKHGGYMVLVAEETPEETMARALLLAQKTIETATQRANLKDIRVEQLEEQNRLQSEQLKISASKVEFHDTVLRSKGNYSTTIIAKELGMTAMKLNKILQEEKVQFLHRKQWLLYEKYQDKGYTKTYTHDYTQSNGEPGLKPHTVWTAKGRCWIHEFMASIKSN